MADGKIRAQDLVSDDAFQVYEKLADKATKAITDIKGELTELTSTYEALVKSLNSTVSKESEAIAKRKKHAEISAKAKAAEAELRLETAKLREAKKQLTIVVAEESKQGIARLKLQKQELINEQQKERSIRKVSGAYAEKSKRLVKLRNEAKNTALNEGILSDAFKRQQKEVLKLDKQLKKIDSSLGQHQRKVGQYSNAVRGLATSFRTLGSAFGFAGGIFLFAAILKDTFRRVKEFDSAINDLAATINQSRSEIQALEKDAINLGGATKYTSTQIVDLQKQLAKKGFDQTEIINSTAAIIDLSVATGEDLSKAAEVASATLRALGLESHEMSRVVDVMAKSFTKTALDLESFTESAKFVTPIAKKAKIPIEELTAVLGTLADNGIKGSIAGTGLRKIISELDKSGKPLNERLKELSKTYLTLGDATDEVGQRAQTSLLVLTEEIEVTDRLAESFKDAAGVAQEMADKQMKSLENQLILLDSAWNRLILSLEKGDGIFSRLLQRGISFDIAVLNQLDRMNKTTDDLFDEAELASYTKTLKEAKDNFELFVKVSSGEGVKDLTFIKKLGIDAEKLETDIDSLTKKHEQLRNEEALLLTMQKEGIWIHTEKGRLKEEELNNSIKQLKNDTNVLAAKKGQLRAIKEIIKREKKLLEPPIEKEKKPLTEAELKALALLERKRKDAADKEARFEKEVLIQRKIRESEANKSILEDKNASYEDQLEALDNYYINLFEIEKLQLEKSLIGWKKTELEKVSIREKNANKVIKIDRDRNNAETALEVSNTERITKNLKKLTAEKQKQIDDEVAALIAKHKEEIRTETSYEKILQKRKKLEEDILRVRTEGAIAVNLAQIKFLEEMISKLDPTAEGVKELIQLLAKLKAELLDIPAPPLTDLQQWGKDAGDVIAKVQDTFEEYAQYVERSIGLLLQNKVDAIESELQANEDKYSRLQAMAGDDEDFKDSLEKARFLKEQELQAKKIKEMKKLAAFEKAMAIPRALMNTAVGVTKALELPFPFNIVAAGIVGALGAVEVSAIINTPLPQYEKGGRVKKNELAIVGEKRHEVVQEPDGSTWITGNKPQLSHLKKGSVIYPSIKKFAQKQGYDNVMKASILTSLNADARRMSRNEAQREFEMNYDAIEKAMVSAVKKTNVNNFVKMPKIDVKLDHALWSLKNTQFK